MKEEPEHEESQESFGRINWEGPRNEEGKQGKIGESNGRARENQGVKRENSGQPGSL